MVQKKIAAIPHMVIRVMVDLMVIFLVGREEPQRAFSSNFPSRSLETPGGTRVNNALQQLLRCAMNLAMVFAALVALIFI